MKSQSLDFLQMLRILNDHQVQYIIVGGVCAVLHGAPITTYDLDIVHARDPENIQNTLSALEILNAHSRLHQKQVKPNHSHLKGKGHVLLQTEYGPLDLLGEAGPNRGYRELVHHTVTGTVRDISFKMLDLETLILIKEETGRDKDLIALPILRATMKETKGGS